MRASRSSKISAATLGRWPSPFRLPRCGSSSPASARKPGSSVPPAGLDGYSARLLDRGSLLLGDSFSLGPADELLLGQKPIAIPVEQIETGLGTGKLLPRDLAVAILVHRLEPLDSLLPGLLGKIAEILEHGPVFVGLQLTVVIVIA